MVRDRVFSSLAAALMLAPLLLAATPNPQLAQAVAAQRDRVSAQPDGATLNDLANLLVEAGELEEAEETYRLAIAAEPDRAEPPFNLALLLASTDHPREAARLLKAMLKQHPGHAWGHYQLGTLRQAKGNRSRALRSYREAFRLDPSLTDPRRNPHVLDNTLATAAMLEAFDLGGSTGTTTQRIYAEPNRISGLLLPPLTAEQAMKSEYKRMSRAPVAPEPEEEEAADGGEDEEEEDEEEPER